MSHFSFKIGTLTEHLLLVNKFDESFRVRLVKFIVTGHLFEVYFGVFFLSSSVQFGVFFKLCTVVCSIVRSSWCGKVLSFVKALHSFVKISTARSHSFSLIISFLIRYLSEFKEGNCLEIVLEPGTLSSEWSVVVSSKRLSHLTLLVCNSEIFWCLHSNLWKKWGLHVLVFGHFVK